MVISDPGIAGAFGGLALGGLQYIVAMNAARRVLAREMEEEGEMPGLAFVVGRLRMLRNFLAGFSLLVMPALGYALGAALGSHGGAR